MLLLVNGLAWGAENTNKLISVSLDSDASTPTVLIKTAEPVGYRYTVYDSFDPTRVVVDFPGMELSDIAESISVDQGAVQEIRVAGFALSSGQLVRVEILLAEGTEYQVNLAEKEFRVAFATDGTKSPTAEVATKAVATNANASATVVNSAVHVTQDATVLRNINLSAGQAVLETDGKPGKFQFFSLGNPPRLVVDLYGLKPAFKERSFPADAGFKQVRVGTYNDKTRLVFDASGNVLPEHLVEGQATGLLVSWNAAASSPVTETQPAEAAQAIVAASPAKAAAPAPAVMIEKAASAGSTLQTLAPANVYAVDFINENGRSVIAVALSKPARVLGPVEEGNLVRFEIVNSSISRALRRTIDASAFPSAVTSVTPYTVTEGNHQNVRIAVELKGPVAYALEQDGSTIRMVIDDGAYAEPKPPAVSQVKVRAPVATSKSKPAATRTAFTTTGSKGTADEMSAEAARYTGEKITLVFDSANVRSILQLIGDVSGLNILASSDVKGDVTLRLIDVPWDQALDLVLETANLGKIQQGNVLRIMPKDKIREIEQTSMKEQQVAIDEGVLVTTTFPISYASVDAMKGFLTDITSDRGSIIADSRNKQLIVRDVAEVLAQMQETIAQIDKPERQVMIEARIVEASTSFTRDLGVKWNFDYDGDRESATGGDESALIGLGGQFLIASTNPAAAGFSSMFSIGGLDDSINLDLRLSALENNGEGRIVSTPRITTLNGESAEISQGTQIPFSTTSDAGANTEFIDAVLKLNVTPEINPDGSVILLINASNSAVGSIVPTSTGNAVSIEKKEAKTKVLVRDGQTTVIGGIFVESETDGASGVPLLKDIPVMGHLFKSTTKSRERRELLIFITPRIVQP
ncbi:MAG: type IV pilus secretin PilQ [Desulfuromonadales bacterium]